MNNNPIRESTDRARDDAIACRLVHFVVRTFNKGQEDNEAVKRFIIYNFERHTRRYPGQKLVILFDLSETGLKHLVRPCRASSRASHISAL